ncbi:MAG: YceI family protein [Flavobacteriales bacterium CG_4_9_14_3_um_filter_32_8]|nr:MAG: YceI family protein [Flavobacteriales bacterium CG_4_9_14_3_um_filter_32_8]
MKKTILLLSIVALSGIFLSSFVNNKKQDLKINTKISSIEWIGKKVTGQHTGAINIKEGSLQVVDGIIKTGKVVIDMNSITNTDMEGEWSQKLLDHLNSADFFDVKNHSASTLEINSVKNIEGNKYIVNGNLTIKGISKPIEFPATIEVKDGKLAAFAEVKIDRTLYDIKYGSGKFFEGLGDKMIDDEFIVKFKIAAE